jgi:hypothetical protein
MPLQTNAIEWEFTAHLLATGTRWSWTKLEPFGRQVDSRLTFCSYREAVANAKAFGFNAAAHKFVVSALETIIPPMRHNFEQRLPAWPCGVAVV